MIGMYCVQRAGQKVALPNTCMHVALTRRHRVEASHC